MSTLIETAEQVARRYDYINKLDFLKAVKEIEGSLYSEDGMKAVLSVWDNHYADQ